MKALLEVVILPVSDPDVSLHFYRDLVGFDLDVDYAPAPAACVRGLYLVVPDIEITRRELVDHGVSVSDIRHKDTNGGWRGGFRAGPDPDRADYASFADFDDPDGNGWVLQERGFGNPLTRGDYDDD